VREDPLRWVAARGTQRGADPATDRWFVKRDGRRAQARYTCWGADHGEGKAQEGQVGRASANRARGARIDFLADKGPEDGQRRATVRS
jgi:hypothetical protein